MIFCEICKKGISSKHKFRLHLKEHDISELDYWRTYIVKNQDAGKCLVCGETLNINRFSLFRGFNVKVHSGKCNACTYETFKAKYGDDADVRWNEYKRLQSVTNTFEYKKEKYGMSSAEFDEYNKSRAVTLKNQINKYGKEIGEKRFNDYVEKQRDAGTSLKYFIDHYGENAGKEKYFELNKKKSHSLENYVKRYGEQDGIEKYLALRNSSKSYTSKIANEFFLELCNGKKPENVYFGEKEFGKMYKINQKFVYYFYDFVDTEKKLIIEFNGDYYHPKEKNDPNWFSENHRGVDSQTAWEHDENKKICAIENGFKIFYIWEHEVIANRSDAIQKCLTFLRSVE